MMKKHRWGSIIILIIVAAFLLLPLIITFIYSFSTTWNDILPSGFTLKYYAEVFSKPEFWPSVLRSVVISIIPIFISGVIIILTMYTSVLYFPKVDKVIQNISMLPHTLKGVLLALGVLALYVDSNAVLSNRIIMLTLVYCISILPYIYQGIRNNIDALNVHQLVEAAQILGASKFKAFIKIIVPNMVSGILVSALLSMAIIFSDYPIVKVIAGSRYFTSQQLLYNSRYMPGQQASVMILVLFFIILVIAGVSYRLKVRKEREEQMMKSEVDK